VTAVGPRPLVFAGGAFHVQHRAIIGPDIDLGDLSAAAVPAPLLPLARSIWQERVRTEFRSIQIMTRFLTEVTGAGDPLDVYAIAADMVADEVRHTELCAAVCRKLGVMPHLPEPVELVEPEAFLRSPLPERALTTAISMLAINETISNALVADLLERCDYEPIRRVLAATIEDEATHGSFGWDYVGASLARFDTGSISHWRAVAAHALGPHQHFAAQVAARRSDSREDERELARFGLLTPERQVTVFERTMKAVIAPRLGALGLLDPESDRAPG
jgi:hypothetical protein